MSQKNLNDIYITNIPVVSKTTSIFSPTCTELTKSHSVITKMTIPETVTNDPDTYIGFMRMFKPEFQQNIVEENAFSGSRVTSYVCDGVPKHHQSIHHIIAI